MEDARIAKTPFFVNQYFPEQRPGMGLDPRKHAIAVCYLVEFSNQSVETVFGGEGNRFEWMELKHALGRPDLWPGSELMLRQLGEARDTERMRTSKSH